LRIGTRAALELATAFYAWRSLADGSKLEPAAAAVLISRTVYAD